jgi:hypothetical protein
MHRGLFDLDQTGTAAVPRRDYAVAELTAQPGDVLDVLEELGGWLLRRWSTGAGGWVPADGTQAL